MNEKEYRHIEKLINEGGDKLKEAANRIKCRKSYNDIRAIINNLFIKLDFGD